MVGTDLTYSIHNYILQYLESSPYPSRSSQTEQRRRSWLQDRRGFRCWTPEEMQAVKDNLNEYLIKMLYGK
jgi:3-hydroxybutyryl-CoA dehydrogenase